MTKVVGLDKLGALGALARTRSAEDEDNNDLLVVKNRSRHWRKKTTLYKLSLWREGTRGWSACLGWADAG